MPEWSLDFVDYMSGKGAVYNGGVSRGLGCERVEIDSDGVLHDFCGNIGFVYACCLTRNLRMFSFSHWGTVCSSFVWMNSSNC